MNLDNFNEPDPDKRLGHVVCSACGREMTWVRASFHEKSVAKYGEYRCPSCESAQIGTLVDNVPVHTAGKGSCPIAKFVVRVLNGLCRVFGRKTRLKVTQEPKKNKVDCAIAEPLKPVADYVKK